MATFNSLRITTFMGLFVFSSIVVGITAYRMSERGAPFDYFFWFSFAAIVSAVTWVLMFPILIVSTLRRGSFWSWVAVDFSASLLICLLWCGSASWTTRSTLARFHSCQIYSIFGQNPVCLQWLMALLFSWLNVLILLVYIVSLVVFIIKARRKVRNVWTCEITDLASLRNVEAVEAQTHDDANALKMTHMDTPNSSLVYQQQPLSYQPAGYNQPPQYPYNQGAPVPEV